MALLSKGFIYFYFHVFFFYSVKTAKHGLKQRATKNVG